MRNPHVTAAIAEQGFLKSIETALRTPGTFDMSEAEVAQKMKLMMRIFTLSKDTVDDLLKIITSLEPAESNDLP